MDRVFRVEPVLHEEKDDVYFEVQKFNGEEWKLIHRGHPLRFRLERMAEIAMISLYKYGT